MTFRQYSKVFYVETISPVIFVIASFVSIPAFGAVIASAGAVFFIVMEIIALKEERAFITIDENGIACAKKNVVIWKYTWSEISGFKKYLIYGYQGLDILLYDKDGMPELYATDNREFQLCKSAIKALDEFCPKDIWPVNRKRTKRS